MYACRLPHLENNYLRIPNFVSESFSFQLETENKLQAIQWVLDPNRPNLAGDIGMDQILASLPADIEKISSQDCATALMPLVADFDRRAKRKVPDSMAHYFPHLVTRPLKMAKGMSTLAKKSLGFTIGECVEVYKLTTQMEDGDEEESGLVKLPWATIKNYFNVAEDDDEV